MASSVDLSPHPRNHLPGELAETTYDVIVVGAGPVGENVADYATRGGLTAVVVEAELVGGECSYWACMPSKVLLRPAEALAAARGVAGAAQAVTGDLDVPAALARRDSFTHDWDDSSQAGWLDSIGVPLVRGVGRLAGAKRVDVTGPDGATVSLTANRAVVVATGSVPVIPPIDGLAAARPWTSRNATSAKKAPRRLAVLGGGVVGVEMAQAWRTLGAEQVTIFARADRLLPGVEPEASARVAKSLREMGIDVRTGTSVVAAARDGDGPVTVTTDKGDTVEADEILVAAGRRPNTRDIGLESVGLEPGRPLATDDGMRVGDTDWLYAVGDVTGRVLLTHQGKYQARIVGAAIADRAAGADVRPTPWSKYAATADARAVPQVVFTEPQVASVGLTEAAARDAGITLKTVDYELGWIAGASVARDGYDGWARLVVDLDARTLVGATFVGPDVAELVHAATIAVVGEVTIDRLWHAVPSYPSVSEIWLRLLEELYREVGLR